MCVKAHVFSTGIVMDIVICAPDDFGIDRRREARFRLHNDVCHWLWSTVSGRHVSGDEAEYTATASGVPFDTDPRHFGN